MGLFVGLALARLFLAELLLVRVDAALQAAQLLQDAQTRAEQQLLDADLPPIKLDEAKPDSD